jgi:heterodisulfide reductase subunit C
MVGERAKILEKKTIYSLEELTPSGEQVRHVYPDLVKCQGCNTCTMSCSQDLNVMEYMSYILYGKIAEVADKSFDCMMCSHCAERCPAELAPYNIALLCRRLYGRYLVPRSQHLISRVAEIKEGKFDAELLELKKMEESELRRRYSKRDIEP